MMATKKYYDFHLDIALVGDSNVGRSSIISQFGGTSGNVVNVPQASRKTFETRKVIDVGKLQD